MFRLVEGLLESRGFYYLVGVLVVAFVVFTTAAKNPSRFCRHCRQANRPMARFCAHCGHPLNES